MVPTSLASLNSWHLSDTSDSSYIELYAVTVPIHSLTFNIFMSWLCCSLSLEHHFSSLGLFFPFLQNQLRHYLYQKVLPKSLGWGKKSFLMLPKCPMHTGIFYTFQLNCISSITPIFCMCLWGRDYVLSLYP